MSRRFQKVLTNLFPVSFLETIETDACDHNYHVKIHVSSDDLCARGGSMYIKVCHSQEECCHYEIPLDENGEGLLTIEDLSAAVVNIVQVDACGNQMINQDSVEITYFINGEQQQEDYARLFTGDHADHYDIAIVNHAIGDASLLITKRIAMQGNRSKPKEEECFQITLQGKGCTQTVLLDASNDFEVMLKGLAIGTYSVCEEDAFADVFYCFNGNESEEATFTLLPGENRLEVINEIQADNSLTIAKYIRNGQGELCRPQRLECFPVRVISDHHDIQLMLDESNDFCIQLHGLYPGYFTIEETTADQNTTYLIDDNCERSFAHLEISNCGDHQVMIINTTQPICQPQQDSQLRICKFIRTRDGCLLRPKDENFQVTIEGCGMCQTLNLNESNNYCVDIASLCSGCYEIYESSCHDYTTSYIINDDRERTSASFVVRDRECYCVQVINAMRNAGTLRVCKYIRNACNDLVRPDAQECFDFTLSSLFCRRTFSLSAENDWCMCFNDLQLGSYEVRELPDECYQSEYQLDCDKPKRRARFIMDGCDRELKVINTARKESCGTLKISKFEETASGELVKPQRDETFHVIVEGCGFKERYCLKAGNNWCIYLDGLQAQEYRIVEEEAECYDASYIVNGERSEEAYVVMGNGNEEICILNHRMREGILQIDARMENCDKERQMPEEGLSIDVLIEGKENCFHVCLNEENGWCVLLDQLPPDTYRIIQKDTLGFSISYEVNGEIQDFARIAMNREDQHVTIINAFARCTGMVKVTKYVEDDFGNQLKPCPDEEFSFEIRGRDFCNTYTLCDRNDFCVYFDDLSEGCYEIIELQPQGDVRYQLNGQPYDKAKFTLGREDVYVDILNKDTKQEGIMIQKRLRRGGALVKPCEDDCFKILLTGRNTHEMFELNAENDFCIMLHDVKKQHYEIKEVCAGAKTYVIDGCEMETGYFLYEGKLKEIVIINEEEPTGALRIEKLVEDECGNYVRPQRWECFEVLIESECFKRKITLDIANNFCVCLYDIPCGHYEIKELSVKGSVAYYIHDIPCENAIVDICNEDVSVMIVNRQSSGGVLHFQGFVEKDGVVVPADPLDEFVLMITTKSSSQSLLLHAGNDFTASLEGLASDAYTITEAGKEDVVFAIEDQRFEDIVCIESNGEYVEINVLKVKKKLPSITVSKWMMNATDKKCRPEADDTFMITLLHHGKKQMFELNAGNGFTRCFDAQQPGSYEILEEEGNARYQINQGAMQEQGTFTLDTQDVNVDVWNQKKQMATIWVQAKKETCEAVDYPEDDDCFKITILGEDTDKQIELSADNKWKTCLTLPYGEYQIKSSEAHTLLVNDRPNETHTICVDAPMMKLQLIYQLPGGCGSILLQKFVRSASCDCLRKPGLKAEYEVEIKSDNYYRIVYLHAANQFQEKLEHLKAGRYEIKEVNAAQVAYIVDGDMECEKAIVQVAQSVHNVKIINEAKKEEYGSIEICKLLKDEEGCYRYPDAQDAYWILIKGEEGTSRVLLNEANHFYASLRNLKDGWYEVAEEDQHGDAVYVVNNGAPMKKGIVHVVSNANTVNVINPIRGNGGRLQLYKWMMEDGMRKKPTRGEYRIQISNLRYHDIVMLSKENDYSMLLQELPSGTYQVKELDHEGVTYQVDQQAESDEAQVNLNDALHTVEILNHANEHGSLQMTKYRRVNGILQRPQADASYEFYLSAPGYQKLFLLDQSNDWKMNLSHLKRGTYVLNERNAEDKVSYVIDEQSEVDRAVIDIDQDAHKVTIINTAQAAGGSLLVDKYIRENNQLVKPSSDASYRLYLSKPGYNQVFTLDEDNGFHLNIQNLEDGTYVLDELDAMGDVSYIINGGSETRYGIVEVRNNQNHVSMINAGALASGSIKVEKFIRENNQLVKPSATDSYRLHVSKPGYNQVFTLDAGNDFTLMIRNLEDGTYVLEELDTSGNVSYIVNGGSETRYGIVEVNSNSNTVSMINTREAVGGSIHIEKFIRRNNQLVKPSATDSYRLHISKPGYNEVFTLQMDNDFHVAVQNLEDGTYVIDELDAPGDVSYIVNGGSETRYGIVEVRGNANHVTMINAQGAAQKGSIHVEKRMRINNQLVKPSADDSFQLYVSKPGYNQTFTLQGDNDFHVAIENLENGTYVLDELDAAGQVSYIINGGSETRYGVVEVADNENAVTMINTQGAAGTGSMFISKYIKNADGSISVPAYGDEYTIEVYNADNIYRVHLNAQNDFQSVLSNMKPGVYHLRELDAGMYRVTYVIDGGEETSEGSVYVQSNARSRVEVRDERRDNLNTLEVFKYLLDKDGNYLPPVAPNEYAFEIRREGFSKRYDLTVSNNWHVTITDLTTGIYEIVETTQDSGRVQYLVNSAVLQDQAFVNAQPAVTNVVGIINLEADVENGSITMRKRMRNPLGELVLPDEAESFVMQVTGENFDRLVGLDKDNGFSATLNNLAYGLYEVEESDAVYEVSYQIDGGAEQQQAFVNVQNGVSPDVTIINTDTSVFYDANRNNGVKIVIE